MNVLEEIRKAVIEGIAQQSKRFTEEALGSSITPHEILDKALIPAMNEVGKLFKRGEYFVPEVLVSARAMQQSMDVIEPLLLEKGNSEKQGRIVIGTIEGDLHSIGKNLVCMMLKGAGFKIIDLGVDVKSEQFVEAVRKEEADFVMISALLTTTMVNMPKVINEIEKAGIRNKVKVFIGGAPVTEEYAKKIRADGYAPDCVSAVELVKSVFFHNSREKEGM